MDLRVCLPELNVGEALCRRGLASETEHLRRQVDAERRPVRRSACAVACRLSGAAADVEHVLVRLNRGGLDEGTVRARQRLVEALGVLSEERPFLAVPCVQLA